MKWRTILLYLPTLYTLQINCIIACQGNDFFMRASLMLLLVTAQESEYRIQNPVFELKETLKILLK
jgi:hypothetical protein